MALFDFWKKAPPSPEEEELRRVFGAKGAAMLQAAAGRPVVVKRHGPFFWADATTEQVWGRGQEGWGRWLIVDGKVVALGVPKALPAMIAQSITEPMDITERVAMACVAANVVLLEKLEAVREERPQPAEWARVRREFEPPHGEGSRWVCFVCDFVRPDLYRLSVDVESLRVDLERVGEFREDRTYWRGPAHVDDNGAHVVASVDADASSPWIDQALTEHAGIAAFARLTLELMALGAPLALIGRAQQAALDEVHHAEQCLTLARRGGVDVTIGALPALSPRPGSRTDLARRVHDDMVVNEAAAVVDLRARAAVCVDDEVRAILLAQADDEQRHVELARDIVDWALSATG